jgi:hypothetical protein
VADIDGVIVRLKRIVAGFDFTRIGMDQSLGRDVANVIVERIQDRSENGNGPDGAAWKKNSTKEPPPGGYKGWKLKRYGWDEPNKRTGQMLSTLALKGKTTVEKDVVTLRYGWNVAPTTGGSPTALVSKQDTKRTDVQKAEYAHTGGAHGIKRPFYAIGDGDAHAVVELCQKSLDDYIKTNG